ncbi:MAG: transglycosylase domain-containing protein [Erysipelotrichaceae bacterium]|nr:transglycosylase domain-containing protein [Erysipelotrichaceae bacterium]
MALFKKKSDNNRKAIEAKGEVASVTPKKTKIEKKRGRRKIYNGIMGFIIFCALLGVVSGVSVIKLILDKSDVVLDLAQLGNSEVSFIYDDQGNEIARLGMEDRINITYADMPQSLIDAFVSIEDSRFFEHPGFDLPRFAKAFLENIRTMSFGQGGSTITMQVIKNSYFAVDTIAVREGGEGIARKVQEIYYSLKINNLISKGKVIELYINKVNYGANTRGVEVAADYYFDKSAKDLTLVESAMLAGLVNAPNSYNPYYNPLLCQERTWEVLYQMNYHGYITDEEYELAKKVDVTNLLCGVKSNTYGDGTTIKNQAYIDVVIKELEDIYDIDVYTDSVKVYTAMNQTVQETCDALADGDIVEFADQYMNAAAACVQNKTGLIVGIFGGRNYDRARKFNYATDSRLNPGSTIKAVFSYPLAFEYGGLSTGSTLTSEPVYYEGTNVRVTEHSLYYPGDVSAECGVASSYNICSLKALRMARQNASDDVIKTYLRGIGFDPEVVEAFNEQFAVGGMGCYISPLQLTAAGAMILNSGKYITPHTITRIEYISSNKEPIVPQYTANQVISPGAAWLTSHLMRVACNQQYQTQGDVTVGFRLGYFSRYNGWGYDFYGKSGTNQLPDALYEQYGFTWNASKDQLLLVSNGDYTTACWVGYDLSNYFDSTTYVSQYDVNLKRDSRIDGAIMEAVEEAYGYPTNENPRPAEVTSIRFIRGLTPYTSLPSYADSQYETWGWILSKFATVEAYKEPTIESITTATASVKDQTITVNYTVYPDEAKLKKDDTTQTFTLGGRSWSGRRVYSPTWIDGVIQYNIVISDEQGNVLVHEKTDQTSFTYTLPEVPTEDTKLKVEVYYAYSIAPVQSNTITNEVIIKGVKPVEPEPQPQPTPTPQPQPQPTPDNQQNA